MDGNGRSKPKRREDPTMRWIERKQLFAAIALQCGISPASVRAWKRVPGARVIAVERATGRKRHLIRPDLHPTH